MPGPLEADLYPPLKEFLESKGFTVRAEVGKCDIVAVRRERDGDLMVAVEMKVAFGLPVIYQALERLPGVDMVYVAVGVPEGRKARGNWDGLVPKAERLCRMLGIGMLSVRNGLVVVHVDPGPYQPRKVPKSREKLLGEFSRRSGDHNVGGTTKRPRVTAYREDALRCAGMLSGRGALRPAALRDALELPKVASLLRTNVYGWFDRKGPGLYAISPAGEEALVQYADVVATQGMGSPSPVASITSASGGGM